MSRVFFSVVNKEVQFVPAELIALVCVLSVLFGAQSARRNGKDVMTFLLAVIAFATTGTVGLHLSLSCIANYSEVPLKCKDYRSFLASMGLVATFGAMSFWLEWNMYDLRSW
jgi:hypothetical protein